MPGVGVLSLHPLRAVDDDVELFLCGRERYGIRLWSASSVPREVNLTTAAFLGMPQGSTCFPIPLLTTLT